MVRKFLLLLPLMFILVACDASNEEFSHEKGQEAYESGDFKNAFKIWKSLADDGDARSQFSLGLLYGNGHGVPKDVNLALKWFGKAALQGVPEAQFNIGILYFNARGVQLSQQIALFWAYMAELSGILQGEELKKLLQDFNENNNETGTNDAQVIDNYVPEIVTKARELQHLIKNGMKIYERQYARDTVKEIMEQAQECLESDYEDCSYYTFFDPL